MDETVEQPTIHITSVIDYVQASEYSTDPSPFLDGVIVNASTSTYHAIIKASLSGFMDSVSEAVDVFPGQTTIPRLRIPRLSSAEALSISDTLLASVVNVELIGPGGTVWDSKQHQVWVCQPDVLLLARIDRDGHRVDLTDSLAWSVNSGATGLDDIAHDVLSRVDRSLLDYGTRSDGEAMRSFIDATVKTIYESLVRLKIQFLPTELVWISRTTCIAQRVRKPGSILSDTLKRANCLDVSILFASILDRLGIEPFLVIVPGHAVVGWKYGSFDLEGETLGNQAAKCGLLDVMTTSQGLSFEQAVSMAEGHYVRGLPLFCRSDGPLGDLARIVDVGAIRRRKVSASPARMDHTEFDEPKYRAWLGGETGHIDIRGIGDPRVNQPIDFPILDLYTELYVQVGLTNLDLELGRMRGAKRISLTEILNKTRCLVIMGDPGSGKTTFLRFVAKTRSSQLDGKVPIYLRLADVHEFAKTSKLALEPPLLIRYWQQQCAKEGITASFAALDKIASEGKCIWLLDSLDELPSEVDRDAIVELLETASKRWSNAQFVITSRPIPVRAKSIPIGFEYVGIDAWSYEDIKSFVRAWTALLHPDATDEKRKQHWGQLLATIMERDDLRRLARNAVMVTAMGVVHYNQRRLPAGRADLLEALIYWLISARHGAAKYATEKPRFVEKCYRAIALSMFEAPGGRKARVGRLWAAGAIASFFPGETADERIQNALDFLSREESQTGVLVRRGQGDVEFWHLSFQEYLAAKEIAGKTDDVENGWWSRLRDHLDAPEWREVIVFVPACLNRLGADRVDLFFERLAEASLAGDLFLKARRAALGGSILGDLHIMGYEPSETPAWGASMNDVIQMFGPQGVTIPLETRYHAAVAYGLGGDARLRNFEATWVKFEADQFLLGAQSVNPDLPNYDPSAADSEGPVTHVTVAPFEIRKYPITVQEFNEFYLDGGYENPRYWTDQSALEWITNDKITQPLAWSEQLLAPNCPVTGVSWFEAQAYCTWLSHRNLNDRVYRLPTESQWEYAARRGIPNGSVFPWGSSVSIGDAAELNCAWSGLRRKTPIGMFHRCCTADGLLDMFGNVEEWCLDSWSPNHTFRPNVSAVPFVDSAIVSRAVRGGSTIRFARLCRPTYRSRIYQHKRYMPVGFRVVRLTL